MVMNACQLLGQSKFQLGGLRKERSELSRNKQHDLIDSLVLETFFLP